MTVQRALPPALVLRLLNLSRQEQFGQSRRNAMRIELQCTICPCRFVAPTKVSEEDMRARITDDGSWYALGDGNTFEDMISAALSERGASRCPECGDPVPVNEESLGRLAMEML